MIQSYSEEETVTEGRIIPLGRRATRRDGLRADYVLRYQRSRIPGFGVGE